MHTARREGEHASSVSSKIYYKLCCFVVFFLAAAASFNGYYDKYRLLDIDEFGNLKGRIAFERFVDGTANRPFIFRQLLPATADWIDAHVSTATKDRLFNRYIHIQINIGRDPYDSPVLHDRVYFFRYVLVYIMVFLFAWAAVYAMYAVCKAVGNPPLVSALSAVAFILLMPYFLVNAGFYYDYPELFFFAVVVWMALKVDWWWILPVAALATFNKESFLLFSPSLFPILQRRRSRNSAILGTGLILLTCAAVYEPLRLRFAQNPGGTVENHVAEQLHSFLQPSLLFVREWNYGLLALVGLNPLTIVLTVWTVWKGWKHLPPAIRRYSLIASAINFPAFFFFCAPGELRDLSMLYITLLLLMAANLRVGSAHPFDVDPSGDPLDPDDSQPKRSLVAAQ